MFFFYLYKILVNPLFQVMLGSGQDWPFRWKRHTEKMLEPEMHGGPWGPEAGRRVGEPLGMAFLGNPENPWLAAAGRGDNPTNGWWFRNPTITSWYGSLSPLFWSGFTHPNWLFGMDFWTTNSHLVYVFPVQEIFFLFRCIFHHKVLGTFGSTRSCSGKGGNFQSWASWRCLRRHGGPTKICLTQQRIRLYQVSI